MNFLKEGPFLTLILIPVLVVGTAGCSILRDGPGEPPPARPDPTPTSVVSSTPAGGGGTSTAPVETLLPGPTATSSSVPADQAVITVSPLQAAVGDVLTVWGEGFPPKTEVQLGFGRVNSEFDLIDQTNTDKEGRFQAELTIPDFVNPEDRWVVAAAVDSLRIKAFSEELDIISSGQASFQVSTHAVQPGEQVQIMGEQLPEDTTVQLGIGRVNAEYDLVASADTGTGGALETSFQIPDFVHPEDQWVIVLTADQGELELFSEPLVVEGDG